MHMRMHMHNMNNVWQPRRPSNTHRGPWSLRGCALEKAVIETGGKVIWLPKYHACCNGIEYVWGNGKKRRRARR